MRDIYPGVPCLELVSPCGTKIQYQRLQPARRMASEFPGARLIEWHRDGAGVNIYPKGQHLWAVEPRKKPVGIGFDYRAA